MKYKKYFTFSFDDGLEQDKKIIRILKEYGLQATFNLNAGLFGKASIKEPLIWSTAYTHCSLAQR